MNTPPPIRVTMLPGRNGKKMPIYPTMPSSIVRIAPSSVSSPESSEARTDKMPPKVDCSSLSQKPEPPPEPPPLPPESPEPPGPVPPPGESGLFSPNPEISKPKNSFHSPSMYNDACTLYQPSCWNCCTSFTMPFSSTT